MVKGGVSGSGQLNLDPFDNIDFSLQRMIRERRISKLVGYICDTEVDS